LSTRLHAQRSTAVSGGFAPFSPFYSEVRAV
jgi:hypothetical protein